MASQDHRLDQDRSPRMRLFILSLSWLSLLACQEQPAAAAEPGPFRSEVLLDGLDQPWSLAFLPAGELLITEKSGQLRHWDGQTLSTISGTPSVAVVRQGGLLDVALDPQFAASPAQRWVYLSYSFAEDGAYGTAVGRGRLQGRQLVDWERIFTLPRLSSRGHHFGSRLVFDRTGRLLISIGDRGERERAQDVADPAGSILRIEADGRIPDDNPFRAEAGAHPALFSIGHRNPQGLSRHPLSGAIWAHEHGPQGGDEVNVLAAGRNYGWPVITYGAEYGSGQAIGEGTAREGMEQPLHVWKPSIAPSGMAFYQGAAFADWQGDLLLGALRGQALVRLQLDGERIVAEHRYQPGTPARIRDVRVGPDGLIYLLTDASNGQLRRLSPR